MLEFSENSSKALHIYAAAQPPVVRTGASGRENEFAHRAHPMYRECGKLCVATRHEAPTIAPCMDATRHSGPNSQARKLGGPGRERAVEWCTPPERAEHEHTQSQSGARGRARGGEGGRRGRAVWSVELHTPVNIVNFYRIEFEKGRRKPPFASCAEVATRRIKLATRSS